MGARWSVLWLMAVLLCLAALNTARAEEPVKKATVTISAQQLQSLNTPFSRQLSKELAATSAAQAGLAAIAASPDAAATPSGPPTFLQRFYKELEESFTAGKAKSSQASLSSGSTSKLQYYGVVPGYTAVYPLYPPIRYPEPIYLPIYVPARYPQSYYPQESYDYQSPAYGKYEEPEHKHYPHEYKHEYEYQHEPEYKQEYKHEPEYKKEYKHEPEYKKEYKHEPEYKEEYKHEPEYKKEYKHEPEYKKEYKHEPEYKEEYKYEPEYKEEYKHEPEYKEEYKHEPEYKEEYKYEHEHEHDHDHEYKPDHEHEEEKEYEHEHDEYKPDHDEYEHEHEEYYPEYEGQYSYDGVCLEEAVRKDCADVGAADLQDADGQNFDAGSITYTSTLACCKHGWDQKHGHDHESAKAAVAADTQRAAVASYDGPVVFDPNSGSTECVWDAAYHSPVAVTETTQRIGVASATCRFENSSMEYCGSPLCEGLVITIQGNIYSTYAVSKIYAPLTKLDSTCQPFFNVTALRLLGEMDALEAEEEEEDTSSPQQQSVIAPAPALEPAPAPALKKTQQPHTIIVRGPTAKPPAPVPTPSVETPSATAPGAGTEQPPSAPALQKGHSRPVVHTPVPAATPAQPVPVVTKPHRPVVHVPVPAPAPAAPAKPAPDVHPHRSRPVIHVPVPGGKALPPWKHTEVATAAVGAQEGEEYAQPSAIVINRPNLPAGQRKVVRNVNGRAPVRKANNYGGTASILAGVITSITTQGKCHGFPYQQGMVEHVIDFDGQPLTDQQYAALPKDTPIVNPGAYKFVFAKESY